MRGRWEKLHQPVLWCIIYNVCIHSDIVFHTNRRVHWMLSVIHKWYQWTAQRWHWNVTQTITQPNHTQTKTFNIKISSLKHLHSFIHSFIHSFLRDVKWAYLEEKTIVAYLKYVTLVQPKYTEHAQAGFALRPINT